MIQIIDLPEKLILHALKIYSDCLDIALPSLIIEQVDEYDMDENGRCYFKKDHFIILLRKRDIGHMLVTLAHELVHVKQFIKDDLASKYNPNIPYKSRWWEKEAFELESILAQKLIDNLHK